MTLIPHSKGAQATLAHRPSPSTTSASPATTSRTSSSTTPSSIDTSASHYQDSLQTPAPTSTPLNLPSSQASPNSIPRHVLTRRRRYLELNPSYFATASSDAELSNPLAYDRLVRRHQSAAEREAEGRKKRWAGTLEAGLVRGEARREGIQDMGRKVVNQRGKEMDMDVGIDWTIAESPDREDGVDEETAKEGEKAAPEDTEEEENSWDDHTNDLMYLKSQMARSNALGSLPDSDGRSLRHELPSAAARSDAAKAGAKQEGEERWRVLLAVRFVSGLDENFDYGLVDEDEGLDGDWEGRRAQEEWFDEEESKIEGAAECQTGVQDF